MTKARAMHGHSREVDSGARARPLWYNVSPSHIKPTAACCLFSVSKITAWILDFYSNGIISTVILKVSSKSRRTPEKLNGERFRRTSERLNEERFRRTSERLNGERFRRWKRGMCGEAIGI